MASPTYYDDPLDDPLDDPTYDDVVLEEGDDEEGGDALAATIISWREEEDDKEVEEPEATTAAAVEVVDLDAEEEEEEEAAASSSVRLRLRGYQGAMRPGYHTSVLCTTPEGHYWAGYVLRWEEMRAAEPCVVRAAVKHSSGDQVWVEELVVEHDRVQKITDPCGALRLLASPSNVEWLHSISGGRDNRRHIVSQLVACCRHPALNASIDEAHRVDALEIELLSALGLSRERHRPTSGAYCDRVLAAPRSQPRPAARAAPRAPRPRAPRRSAKNTIRKTAACKRDAAKVLTVVIGDQIAYAEVLD